MLAAPVSVSSYELCSVDLEGLVLLVSSICSGSYTLSASSSEHQGKGFDGGIPLRVESSKVYLSVCVFLSLSLCLSLHV